MIFRKTFTPTPSREPRDNASPQRWVVFTRKLLAAFARKLTGKRIEAERGLRGFIVAMNLTNTTKSRKRQVQFLLPPRHRERVRGFAFPFERVTQLPRAMGPSIRVMPSERILSSCSNAHSRYCDNPSSISFTGPNHELRKLPLEPVTRASRFMESTSLVATSKNTT